MEDVLITVDYPTIADVTITVENPDIADVEVIVDYSQGGADGKSAYQIALDNGFAGTEQEWLASLTPDISNKVDKSQTINGHPLSSKVIITKSDVGLGNANNTADIDKEVSIPQQAAFDLKADTTYVDTQDAILSSEIALKADAITTAAALALKADASPTTSALALKADTSTVNTALATKADASATTAALALKADASTTTSALALKADTSTVNTALGLKADKTITVNGQSLAGNVSLTKSDISLANVDNTSDVNKPVSTAQATAIALKVDKTTTVNAKALSGNIVLDKTDIGLTNVDNTSDVNKPVSTTQQTALDLKAPLSNPTFPTDVIINRSTNGATIVTVVNSNSGTSADARFSASNGTVALQMLIRGANYTANQNNGFFNLTGTGSLGWLMNGVERMRLQTNGNFGIGTSSPAGGFHVARETVGVGTISTTATGITVTGVSTDFTNRFKIGQTITANGETRTISAIASDTSMTTDAWTNTNTSIAYTTTSLNALIIRRNGEAFISQLTVNGGLLYTSGTTGLVAQSAAITGIVKGNGTSAPSAATANTDYLPVNNPTMTGTVTIPSPFTLGGTPVTSTATKLNLITGAAGTTGSTTSSIVFSNNPLLIAPRLTGYTVATLPTGAVGTLAYVTDALTPAIGSMVIGGGAARAQVWHNGTNWTVTGI